jgi:purine-nucleoside/S-methyl-5'-thioadenosine phosphorylase / adenosine deaminase
MTADSGGGFELTQLNGLPAYICDAWAHEPRLVHAIFTRHGGVSRPPYASLNLGLAVGDDPDAVHTNHERICEALGIDAVRMAKCHLVHGHTIQVVTATLAGGWLGKADGMVTAQPGVFLTMRFADCVPILLHDPQRRAVGLVHAGWRGTVQDVAGAAVRTMVSELGCAPGDISAVIGPSIGPCCYEVGADVISAVGSALPDSAPLFGYRNGGAAHFDIWEANRRQLLAAGAGCVRAMDLCTACRNDRFFSHRAEGGRTGRFGAVIGYRAS